MESKLYKWNKRGSRIVINTGYRKFDNQIVCISRGNVIGGCQYSACVRPYNETQIYGGEHRPKGQLRDYDLQFFKLPTYVRNYIDDITLNNTCIVYEFGTYGKGYNAQKEVFGFIIEQGGEYKIFNIADTYVEKKQRCLEYIREVLREERK